MSNGDFIPGRDNDLLAWATGYSAKISSTPTAFGLTAADATALAALVADYTTRLATATNPATRTKPAITAKNTSRAALVARCRQLARIINADPDTTDTQRQELGLHVQDVEPTPHPVPATRPLVGVDTLGGLQSGVRLADEMTPTSRAKPAGVSGALLWAKIDGAAPANTAECQFVGMATRTRHVVTHPPTALNKTVWVIAQWVNDKGEAGPISVPASASIAA